MSSESSLLTTAASDASSCAESRYFSSRGPGRGPRISTSGADYCAMQSASLRRRSYNLKVRGVVLAKAVAPTSRGSSGGNNQKVLCVCKLCEGRRLLSKSTCYRHLRLEAQAAEVDILNRYWSQAFKNASRIQALRLYSIMHFAGLQFCNVSPDQIH